MARAVRVIISNSSRSAARAVALPLVLCRAAASPDDWATVCEVNASMTSLISANERPPSEAAGNAVACAAPKSRRRVNISNLRISELSIRLSPFRACLPRDGGQLADSR
jgi:hypothetical protein